MCWNICSNEFGIIPLNSGLDFTPTNKNKRDIILIHRIYRLIRNILFDGAETRVTKVMESGNIIKGCPGTNVKLDTGASELPFVWSVCLSYLAL